MIQYCSIWRDRLSSENADNNRFLKFEINTHDGFNALSKQVRVNFLFVKKLNWNRSFPNKMFHSSEVEIRVKQCLVTPNFDILVSHLNRKLNLPSSFKNASFSYLCELIFSNFFNSFILEHVYFFKDVLCDFSYQQHVARRELILFMRCKRFFEPLIFSSFVMKNACRGKASYNL